MKVCLSCARAFDADGWTCPSCGWAPPIVRGFPSFAPSRAEGGRGFRAEAFARLASLEAASFWFRARNRLVTWALRAHFPSARRFLEIGCGTGFVLSGIAEAAPELDLHGSEVSSAGLPFAAGRVPSARLFQMDARQIPFEAEFDAIGAFDVLEHIEEDQVVLAAMRQAVTPGGGILVTVPQHPFLWSETDDVAGHVRRYTRRELVEKVRRAGFRVERVTSFVSLLFPAMALSRLVPKRSRKSSGVADELAVSGALGRALEAVMDFERLCIRRGMSFPLGGSLFLVARRS